MLQWFRESPRRVAAILVVSLAALGVPHTADPNHDADYAIGVVAAQDGWANKLVSGDLRTEKHHDHCIACHATRSGWTRPQLRHAAPASLAAPVLLFAIVTARSADPLAQPSLRAPPSPRLA